MQNFKPVLALGSIAFMGLALWAGAQHGQQGDTMAVAAGRFLQALDDQTRARASFDFESPERVNWHFIPRARQGLPIKEMNGEQRALAFGLLDSGLSDTGSLKATTIMSLEAVLRDIEKGSGATRDPELYYFSIFGKPSNSGQWGWRVEGHHLSLNFTVVDGKVASATPAFFGANPAEVRSGPREGLQALSNYEEYGLQLVGSLDDDQKKLALAAAEAPRDIESNYGDTGQNGLPVKPAALDFEGIPFEKLSRNQKAMLLNLLNAYINDMPVDIAGNWAAELGEAETAGKLSFAWYGSTDRKEPHGYQVQAPTFQVEFNNTQNGANHIHSVWRSNTDDFDLAGR